MTARPGRPDVPSSPMRLTVPLNALRAFEAAARHLSIKDAAAEIGVTPSAVSHQLRILEEAFRLELMRRAGPGLELTAAGRALAPDLTAGFARIVGAVGALQTQRRLGPLRLSIMPTFASHWLSPRLATYPLARPGFELLISTTQDLADLNAGGADAGIRHGRGNWPGLAADLLFQESVVLLGRPGWPAAGDVRAAAARMPLFLPQRLQADFERWNATLPGGAIRPASITIVDTSGLGLKAAMDGVGLTLGGFEMVQDDIAAARLAVLFDHRIGTDSGYYLVYPPALARDRRIRNLKPWLLAEASKVGRA
ncbi:LysR family transcriptional regulator [Stella humosa]|uniref:LysR family transcriptional regulator n=1 Tax=Stella humosa TaxID=94 RepID=A0A3N1L4X4_9PROT|nr:LysR substrate-binding domain-containing protein [Stella humosa]ROP84445.1 LysR family transcriptional regulator [Stella humosa]BBK33963.1 LysR family transcriptional regulator [Stella humosa]